MHFLLLADADCGILAGYGDFAKIKGWDEELYDQFGVPFKVRLCTDLSISSTDHPFSFLGPHIQDGQSRDEDNQQGKSQVHRKSNNGQRAYQVEFEVNEQEKGNLCQFGVRL